MKEKWYKVNMTSHILSNLDISNVFSLHKQRASVLSSALLHNQGGILINIGNTFPVEVSINVPKGFLEIIL